MPETTFETPDGIEIVEDVSEDFRGTAYKFKTEESVTVDDGFGRESTTRFFIISAATPPMGGPETMVFPAKEDGNEPTSWGEVAGRMRNGHSFGSVLDEFQRRYL